MRRTLAALALAPGIAFAACDGDAIVVLDASASMAAQTSDAGRPPRIDSARRALSVVVPEVAPVRRVGLMVYGPGGPGGCGGVRLLVPPLPDAAGEILARAGSVDPGGSTALTRAVREAATALGPGGTVVLVTDGQETCGGRPCELAERLADHRSDLTVHVIGFRVGQAYPPPGFERGGPGANARIPGTSCLAEATGGIDTSAGDAEELIAALRRVLGCALLF